MIDYIYVTSASVAAVFVTRWIGLVGAEENRNTNDRPGDRTAVSGIK